MEKRLVVAIDGPAGAGKSTVARKVAEALGYLYIDTGAMYRALTLAVLRAGAPVDDAAAVTAVVQRCRVSLAPGPNGNRVFLNGEEVTGEIRTLAVSNAVSQVAAIPAVRQHLVELQRQLARAGGVVMDGRDIGTVVLPNADLKIFLTASLEERARRRYRETQALGHGSNLEEIRKNLEERDRLDSGRATSPLRIAEDAVVIDTTDWSIEQVVTHVLRLCRRRLEACCTE
ncbi:MAG: cytidylate kinase [Firmicutes bacterium ZCTH02-B6]|nr:MAG: cytidylate kinase [Firmicutes bacterium ZCTH02-B6]